MIKKFTVSKLQGLLQADRRQIFSAYIVNTGNSEVDRDPGQIFMIVIVIMMIMIIAVIIMTLMIVMIMMIMMIMVIVIIVMILMIVMIVNTGISESEMDRDPAQIIIVRKLIHDNDDTDDDLSPQSTTKLRSE